MTKRDREIESRVGEVVARDSWSLLDWRRRPIFWSSSNHLATQTQSCLVPTPAKPTPPRETHLPLPLPTETHHTHRYLLLSQKLRICAWSENLRFTKETMLVPFSCLCFYWESVFLFGLFGFVTVTLCLWLSLLHYIDKRDRERERVEFVEIIFSLLIDSWA